MGLNLAPAARVQKYEAAGFWGDGCLHDFIAARALEAPDAPALIDANDRQSFATGTPVTLTNRETQFSIEKLGLVFGELGLMAGDLVAIQLPQIVEAPISILAAARAGLIVCLLPPHWGYSEISVALKDVAPRAILSWRAPGPNGEERMNALRDIAVELSSIRCLLAFGDNVPDGIVPLGAFAQEVLRAMIGEDPGVGEQIKFEDPTEANDAVVVTWPSSGGAGARAFARSHNEIKATGLPVVNGANLDDGCSLLCPYPLSSFAALGMFLAPWLLTRGCLVFQRAFDLDAFSAAIKARSISFSAVPAAIEQPVASKLADLAGIGELGAPGQTFHLGILRDLRVANSQVQAPPPGELKLLDILNINDLALQAKVRTGPGQINIPDRNVPLASLQPAPLIETHIAPPRPDDALGSAELFVRSPMTPSVAVGGEGGVFSPLQGAEGFVAANLIARRSAGTLVPSAVKPSDHLTHGAMMLNMGALKTLYGGWPGAAALHIEAVADNIMGHRLRVTLNICATEMADDERLSLIEAFCSYLRKQGAGAHLIPDIIELAFVSDDGQPVEKASGASETAIIDSAANEPGHLPLRARA